MIGNKRGDLIESICGGAGRKFNGKPCRYYVQIPTKQCQLLKARKMDVFWEQCRGAYLIFYDTVQVLSKMFKVRYPGLPIDEAEDFDFEGVIRRLQQQDIPLENLTVWRKYVNKTVYLEIKKALSKRGLVPEKKNCGSCKYLSPSKPYICTKTGHPRKKTDPPCETYGPDIAYFLSIDEKTSPGDGSNHQRSDRLLLEMITVKNQEPNTPETLIIAKEEQKRSALSMIIAMLAQRPGHKESGSKKRKKYARHYEVFINLVHLLAKGVPRESVIKHLAKRFTVNEKTIRRDIIEIRNFLREQHALEWLK